MNCREATAIVDLHTRPQSFWGRLGYGLHMIHCRACLRYRKLSRILGEAAREYARVSIATVDQDRLNRSLLMKHGPKK